MGRTVSLEVRKNLYRVIGHGTYKYYSEYTKLAQTVEALKNDVKSARITPFFADWSFGELSFHLTERTILELRS